MNEVPVGRIAVTTTITGRMKFCRPTNSDKALQATVNRSLSTTPTDDRAGQ